MCASKSGFDTFGIQKNLHFGPNLGKWAQRHFSLFPLISIISSFIFLSPTPHSSLSLAFFPFTSALFRAPTGFTAFCPPFSCCIPQTSKMDRQTDRLVDVSSPFHLMLLNPHLFLINLGTAFNPFKVSVFFKNGFKCCMLL